METMAIIARLAGEGIGPFKSFDFDFSDAEGNPHPGPHIFAGINGSGKSTILKTLAWMFAAPGSDDGFPWEEWQHLIEGYECSRAMIVINMPPYGTFVLAKTMNVGPKWEEMTRSWVAELLGKGGANSQKVEPTIRGQLPDALGMNVNRIGAAFPEPSLSSWQLPERTIGYLTIGDDKAPTLFHWLTTVLAVAYSPSRLLKHLPQIDQTLRLSHFQHKALAFEGTIQNETIQSWLLELFTKKAISAERNQEQTKYSTALTRFQDAVSLICAQNVKLDVDIEPSLQLRLEIFNKKLDFSQLPDGVRSTVGWLADFMLRADCLRPAQLERAVLFLDEVDAHLHPKWQRSILPSVRKALPEVQLFATSHSPFVISSCPGARIHVLKVDDSGRASNLPPVDAPIGESVLATMKDIFGVDSRFDVETEKQLEEWNQLRRSRAAGKLSPKESQRLETLTQDLSSRSEELRQIVAPAVSISDSLLASLKSSAEAGNRQTAKAKATKVGK
jgi:predicted ATP-binding protein involved in virulence